MRQKLAQCYGEIEIMRLNQLRAFSRITATGVPGPEGSIQKIFWSELNQRLQQVAQELLGAYGQLAAGDERAVDNGIWSYGYLRTRGNTIEAGTSEVQRNIIGHFVLGLPEELLRGHDGIRIKREPAASQRQCAEIFRGRVPDGLKSGASWKLIPLMTPHCGPRWLTRATRELFSPRSMGAWAWGKSNSFY